VVGHRVCSRRGRIGENEVETDRGRKGRGNLGAWIVAMGFRIVVVVVCGVDAEAVDGAIKEGA
jgi:hypothetical protein